MPERNFWQNYTQRTAGRHDLMTTDDNSRNLQDLADRIRQWGRELGFQQVAITDIDLTEAGDRLQHWLGKGYQGDMAWMAHHGEKRWHPEQLLPGTLRVISVRLDYLPADTALVKMLRQPDKAYISRYALGRDYHKLMRKRLATLSRQIEDSAPGTVITRPFVDSAPVMEKPLAAKAGLGWIGKHTLVLNSEAGSWFFLGEIYINLPLPVDYSEQPDRCGNCSACLSICPTNAFPAPYQLDARRCISYLTIEHKGAIPEPLRALMGNRVFGCDDCQAICPWNRFARFSGEDDFKPRHGLHNSDLVSLFLWSEEEFNTRTAGSPIRRIGHERWLRNLAVGIGNSSPSEAALTALATRAEHASPLVREHVQWARHQLELARRNDTQPVRLFPTIRHLE